VNWVSRFLISEEPAILGKNPFYDGMISFNEEKKAILALACVIID